MKRGYVAKVGPGSYQPQPPALKSRGDLIPTDQLAVADADLAQNAIASRAVAEADVSGHFASWTMIIKL
jgi:hypothetical protein